MDLLDGRAAGPLIRKLTPDGLFDRELIYDGTRIMYFRNRIWNAYERVAEVPPEELF